MKYLEMVTMSEGFKETEIGLIPEEWEVKKIGDVCQQVRNSFNPNEKDIRTYIGLEHINEGSLTLNGVGSSSDVKSGKFVFLKGQILFGKLRPYFRKVYRPDFDGVCSTDILVLDKKDDYYNRFLFYFFANPLIIDIATQSSEGTKMPRASWKYLTELKFAFPNFNEQKAISDVLYVLDQKIHLNHQMNQTLEKIGENLFRHWFVHFEFPDVEGRPYKSSGGEMVDSELGEIPAGWIIKDFDSLCNITSSKRIFHREYVEDGIPFYRSKEIILLSKNQQIKDPLFISKNKYEEISKKFGVPNDGDLLMTSVGTLGIPYIVKSKEKFYFKDGNLMWFNSFKGMNNAYLYYWISSPYGQQILDSISIGSTQKALTIDSLKKVKVPLPLSNDNLLKKFDDLTKIILCQIEVFNRQNHILTDIRDSILPKLMSGKIRVNIPEEATAK